jgi:hypothetical protein
VVGEAGDDDETEDEDDSLKTEIEEMVESVRSIGSPLVLLPSTVVKSPSRFRSRSSGGESRGRRGGLPTIFHVSSAERGFWAWLWLWFWFWIGRGETMGETMPDWVFSMAQENTAERGMRRGSESRKRRVEMTGWTMHSPAWRKVNEKKRGGRGIGQRGVRFVVTLCSTKKQFLSHVAQHPLVTPKGTIHLPT